MVNIGNALEFDRREFYANRHSLTNLRKLMDIIFLRELKVETLIGVYEWEKRAPQTLQLDLDIALPDSRACQSDNIDDALDYSKVAQHIQTVLSERSEERRVGKECRS